jgi:hypothetical protein
VLRDTVVGLFAAAGAAIFSQAPEFFQQYLQRLGGALDELQRIREQISAVANRLNELISARDSLLHAGGFERPFAFVTHFQPDIALGTWIAFRPALPLSLECLGYALFGIVVGVTLFHIFHFPFRRRDYPLRRPFT